MKKLDFQLYFTPFPFVFFLPWPKVIRNQKIKQFFSYPLRKHNLYLSSKVDDIFNYLLEKNNSELWHEDLVCPNDFYTLNPSWYSDGWHWYIKIFVKNKGFKSIFTDLNWEGIIDGKYQKRNIILFLGLKRRYPNLIFYFLYVLYVLFVNKLKNIIRLFYA